MAARSTDPVPPAGLALIRNYRRGWLRGDVIAGVTIAAYLVPQVMAYATIAGLPPAAGLWASVGPLLAYAALGSSLLLSAGPESSTALMTGATVAALGNGDAARTAGIAAMLAVVVGLICLAGWLFKAGFFADLLSHPVLVGYMAGIAVLMVVSQLGKVLGFQLRGERPYQQLWYAISHAARTNAPTVIVAATVLVILVIMSRLRPTWPTPLIVMVLAAVVTEVFHLDHHGVAVVGTVPRSLPTPAIPDIAAADLVRLIPAAFGLAIVGYTDNVLTARAFSEGEPIDANREFLALGATNLAGGLLRGFPVSSSGSRTAIGAAVGAKTQLSAVVTAITVFVAMLAVGPALGHFPMAALGGVVVFAAAKLVEVGEIRRIARFRRSELFLAAVAFLGVLVTDVLVGIAVAIGLSILDLLRRVARPHDAVLGYVPGVPGMHDVDDYPNAVTVPGLMVYRYDSPLFFANAEDFRRRAMAAVDASDTPITWFVLNAEGIVEVDLTGIDALDDLRSELTRRDIVFAMARVKHELADDLEAAGFLRKVGPDRLFATLPTAVAAFQASAVTD